MARGEVKLPVVDVVLVHILLVIMLPPVQGIRYLI